MKIQDLKPAVGDSKKRKRVGRGSGSGHGKTSCRGHKGQNSRSGGGVRPGFEGGQMPLQRRLPKRGFTCPSSVDYTILNVRDIQGLSLDEISAEKLMEAGVIKSVRDGIKVLGMGDISRAVKLKVEAISASAKQKIEAAGGSVEVV